MLDIEGSMGQFYGYVYAWDTADGASLIRPTDLRIISLNASHDYPAYVSSINLTMPESR